MSTVGLRHRALARLYAVANPGGEAGFVDVACGKAKRGDNAIGVCSLQIEAVKRQKKFGRNKGCALIAIRKRVITRNAKTIGRREFGCVGQPATEILDRVKTMRQSDREPGEDETYTQA